MSLKTIGQRIKYLRKELKLTQEEFGEKIGVKGNTVTGYERGTRTPSDSIINYICLVFNINQTWLRTGEGEMSLDGLNSDSALSSLWAEYNCNNVEMDFLKSYFSLKKSDRTAFCKILHKMFPDSIPEPQNTEPWTDIDGFEEVIPPTVDDLTGILNELETVKRQNKELQARIDALERENSKEEGLNAEELHAELDRQLKAQETVKEKSGAS